MNTGHRQTAFLILITFSTPRRAPKGRLLNRTKRLVSYTITFDTVQNCSSRRFLLFPTFEASTGSVGHGEGWADRFVLLSNHNIEWREPELRNVKPVHNHHCTHAVPASETTGLIWLCREPAVLSSFCGQPSQMSVDTAGFSGGRMCWTRQDVRWLLF